MSRTNQYLYHKRHKPNAKIVGKYEIEDEIFFHKYFLSNLKLIYYALK